MAVLGDSAAAHFEIPETWMDPYKIGPHTYGKKKEKEMNVYSCLFKEKEMNVYSCLFKEKEMNVYSCLFMF